MNKKFTVIRFLSAFAIAMLLSIVIIFSVSQEPGTASYNLFLRTDCRVNAIFLMFLQAVCH